MNAPSNSSAKDELPAGSRALELPVPYLADNRLTAWGIDFNADHLDLTILTGIPNPKPVHHSTPSTDAKLPPVGRVHAYFEQAKAMFADRIALASPAVVAVERPTGKFPTPILGNLLGAICCALIEAVGPSTYFLCSPGQWKKEVIGNGAAMKQDVADWYATRYRKAPLTFDQADSTALAAYARLEISRATTAP